MGNNEASSSSHHGSKVRIAERPASASIHNSRTQLGSATQVATGSIHNSRTQLGSTTQLKSGTGSKTQLSGSKTQLNGSKSALVTKTASGSVGKLYTAESGKSASLTNISKAQGGQQQSASTGSLNATTPRSLSKSHLSNNNVAKTSSRQDIVIEPLEL